MHSNLSIKVLKTPKYQIIRYHDIHVYSLTGESANEEPKIIKLSRNEAYANVQLHKAEEEVHIYEDLHSAAQSQGTVITTRNEAYASWTMHTV